MLCFRNLILAVIALSSLETILSVNGETDEMPLETCEGGFEMTFFNFFVKVDNVYDECQNFTDIGHTVRLVVEEVESQIPEYEDEFIHADVCTLPEVVVADTVGGRFLRQLQGSGGRYSYAGGGKCKKCRRNRRINRSGRYLDLDE